MAGDTEREPGRLQCVAAAKDACCAATGKVVSNTAEARRWLTAQGISAFRRGRPAGEGAVECEDPA